MNAKSSLENLLVELPSKNSANNSYLNVSGVKTESGQISQIDYKSQMVGNLNFNKPNKDSESSQL